MCLTETPAIGDDLISCFDTRVRRGLHRSGEIDARNKWKCSDDWRTARERQPIFVVHCRVVNSDRDIARHEVIFFQRDQVRRNVFTISVREECFEGHGFARTALVTEFQDVLLERLLLVEPGKAGWLDLIAPA